MGFNKYFRFLKTQRLTSKKLLNLLLYKNKYRYHSQLLSMPFYLTIETGNICNLKCPLCPTGQGHSGMRQGFLSFDNFRSIIDQIGNYLLHIDLFNWGEPFLNKNIIPMIKYANSKYINTALSTNLNILDKEFAKELLCSGLDTLIISCHGATSESYLKYHIGGDFDRVINNMKLLIQEKKHLNIKSPLLKWQFLVFRYNQSEIQLAKDMANKLGIILNIKKMRTDMGKEILYESSISIKRDKLWIPTVPQYSRYNIAEDRIFRKTTTCLNPWRTSTINWNGDVFPCCMVAFDKFSFGNMFRTSFKNVWNNDKYVSARDILLGRENNNIQTICHLCKENGFFHAD
ncbi:MAG: radical SAM protein [bacterium]|nr:radical SAM protein [bacterium]